MVSDDQSLHIQEQYTDWPYPKVSLLARVPKEHLWQLNYEWIASRSGVKPHKPARIWITGAGTFQPYVFAEANPNARILATDISETSLKIARRRCALKGKKNVRLEKLDLNDIQSYPPGSFDLIECYGVLMNLKAPGEVLKALTSRLSENGILRIMVYPHYGRQRIFQIQRLAQLLGLHARNRKHPQLLKKVITNLPSDHPLRYAFFSYHDTRSSEGIVDGFLHAGDRAFTGIELATLLNEAGLDLSFCLHRPWGQPNIMEERLQMPGFDAAFWLHYLDLWQSLKTNFVLCLRKKTDFASFDSQDWEGHPLFLWKNRELGLRHRARLLRLSLTGTSLQSRTHDGLLRVGPKEMRLITKGVRSEGSAKDLFPEISKHRPLLESTPFLMPNTHFVPRLGRRVPNPLYDFLFDAFVFAETWKTTPAIPSLGEQILKWKEEARPLEDGLHPFGLTPYGTYTYSPRRIFEASEGFLDLVPSSFDAVKLDKDSEKLSQTAKTLSKLKVDKKDFSPGELRELWFLFHSYRDLFCDIEN